MTTTAVTDQTERALLARIPTGLYIDGRWTEAADGGRFEVVDPSTETVLATVADARPDDGDRALAAAHDAQPSWGRTPPRVRAEILRQAFELVTIRAEDFALTMTLEMGKPLAEAHAEVTYGAEFLRWFGEEAPRISGRYSTAPDGANRLLVTRRPVGPCLFITPWNFPLAMATRKIAPAIAAGCTMVLKPAALTPLSAAAAHRGPRGRRPAAGCPQRHPHDRPGVGERPAAVGRAAAQAVVHRLDTGRPAAHRRLGRPGAPGLDGARRQRPLHRLRRRRPRRRRRGSARRQAAQRR